MKINAVKKTCAGRRVLDFAGTELEQGKIYAVIGANGSGKSTLAKLIAGIDKPDGGGRATDAAVRYMPQKSFAFRMTLRKNLLLCGSAERAEELIEKLSLTALADKPAKKLSGGETARMALARVLMDKCDLLVLDEPTAAMDMESTVLSEELIREYCRDTGCAVLMITHSLQQAKRIADRTLFMSGGRLIEEGNTRELFAAPQNPETARFIEFYGPETAG